MILKLSIIIIAHDRGNFLQFAIDSSINQSAPKESYEIIVVKNFESHVDDKKIEDFGGKAIYTEEKSLGSKLAIGIKESRGEIISFLEDDDIFSTDKVKKVLDVFSDNKIVYYHNNFSFISKSGKLYKRSRSYRIRKDSNLMINEKSKLLTAKAITKTIKLKGAFNLSCISIRKNVIHDKITKLRGVNVAADYFMFYSALDSGLKIFLDNNLLTKYRVHQSNNSLIFTPDVITFTQSKITFFMEDFKGLNSIRSVVNNKLLYDYISCQIVIPQMALSMLGSQTKEAIHQTNKNLCCIIKNFSFEILVLSLLNIINKIIPNFGNRFYFWYENRMFKKILQEE